MENKYVYHGSSVEGLTRLEPFECKHGKPYVYATTSYITILFFGAKGQGMFDGWMKEVDGIPTYFEARPNGLKERYWGKSCYCYCLPPDTFTNATGDPCEVVSEVPVDIIKSIKIDDIGKEFEKLIEKGEMKIAYYNTTPQNTKKICDKYALKQLVDRGYFEGKQFRQRAWASEYYKALIANYINKKDV